MTRPVCPENHAMQGYGRLRPARCNPLAALSLEAFSRVGAWTPPLPPRNADAAAPPAIGIFGALALEVRRTGAVNSDATEH